MDGIQQTEIFARLRTLEMTLEGHLATCNESRKSAERSMARMEATLDNVHKSVEGLKDEVHFDKALYHGKDKAFRLVFATIFGTCTAIGSIWIIIEYFTK